MPDTTISTNEIPNVFNGLKVSKRRSCELVASPSPCVKKALFHLERLKKLTKLPQDFSLPPVFEDLQEKEISQKKQLRFSLTEQTLSDAESGVFSEDELKVEGFGYQTHVKQDADLGTLMSRIQLTPQEVFNQVANLIMRLEFDRAATERALELERSRVKSLMLKIDGMAQRRLAQLPEVVQKEHDACAVDIIELEWHVAYTERHLERSRAKMSAAELLNASLKEDIAFVKEHCPLVEEKLESEKQAMEKIKEMQRETDQELADARLVQEEAEKKYENAVKLADAERGKIRRELDAVRQQLNMLRKDFSHSKSMHQAYVKKAEESRERLVHQDEELVVLEKRIEEVKDQEQTEFNRIQELRESIRQVEFETGELTKKKNDLEKELEEMRSSMEEQLANLEKTYKENLRTLRNLQESNRDIKYDIEDMKEEMKTSEKAIVKAERELLRYHKERERMEEQLRIANDDVSNISMVNVELKNQLEKEEAKSQALEEALKETAENLRRQVNEEMKQRTALEAKRQQNSKALLKGKSENVKKKQLIEKTLEETMQAVIKATEEVKRLQEEHDAAVEVIVDLEKKLAEVNAEHEEVESNLLAKKREIEPVEAKLQEEQMGLRERINELQFEEAQLERKLKELQLTQGTMQKRYSNTAKNIELLKDEFEELQIQLQKGEETNSSLQSHLDQAMARMADRENAHRKLMKEREEVKLKLEKKVEEELEINKEVADRFRELQSEHLDLKNRLMSLYDNKVKMEVNIKDHKQLLALQGKLNTALEEYYKNRNNFNKAGLNKFRIKSQASNAMMTNVQRGLEMAIDNVSCFLRGQVDGSAASQVHRAAMDHLR